MTPLRKNLYEWEVYVGNIKSCFPQQRKPGKIYSCQVDVQKINYPTSEVESSGRYGVLIIVEIDVVVNDEVAVSELNVDLNGEIDDSI